ncbi:class I SAM-dependent methyltransferase [Candidatus Symbiobacter mobilis]|uniref:SAM-dependent methyltransferase n=1 Tax=Candidatus Symbiobacter mobilis CR TaxID=946483 RepID=U5NDR8_9BURK|nr:class I SAM-dependent methyltransferase [Candidatus Symbiobacter mobilis]AGX88348.1 SAM-dependent methyltransferase [Candidatus Symbiobacter mobilis CR]
MGTDSEWEQWGQRDPYYGVITHPKFRRDNFDETARSEFFESGQCHVQHILATCRQQIDSTFKPSRILDFGCGVGRLLIAFSAQAVQVVGLDVSDSMLSEARRNCEEIGVRNVVLIKSDDDLTLLEGTFDMIHSTIVFQHIQPQRGLRLFARLLGYLAPSGIGTIQITYAKAMYAPNLGAAPSTASLTVSNVWSNLSSTLKRFIINDLLSGFSYSRKDPEMQMNVYNLNQLMFIMQEIGIKRCYTEFTDHGGELGVFLYFQRPHTP